MDTLLANVNAIVLEGDPLNIYYVGGQSEKILGYTKQEWFDDPNGPNGFWVKHLHPDDEEKVKICANAIAKGENHSFEYRMLAADGHWVWFFDTVNVETQKGIPIKARSVMVDITERKRDEKALEQSESRFRLISENTTDFIMLLDKDVNILFINRVAPGLTIEDVLGTSAYNYISEQDKDSMKECLDYVIKTNNPSKYYINLDVGNGASLTIESRVSPITQSGKVTSLVVIGTDITERKHAEEALQESEQYLKTAQAMAHIGHWKLDTLTQEVQGSEELFRIFGLSQKEATLEGFAGVVHPDDREYDLYHIRRGMETGEPWDIEHRVICKDGTLKHVHAIGEVIKNDEGKIITLIGTVQDITEQKRRETAIRRLNSAMEQASEGMVIADMESSIISYTNEAYAKMLGYEANEMVGMMFRSFNKEILSDEFRDQTIREIVQSHSKYVLEMEQIKKDGTVFPTRLSFSTLQSGDEESHELILVIEDITERKHFEAALQESSEKYSKMFMLSPNLISITNLEDGLILQANQAFCELTQYDLEELIGHTTAELNLWDDVSRRDMMSQVLQDKGYIKDFEVRVRQKTGSIIDLIFSAQIINIGDKSCLLSVGTDITERKRDEEKLKEYAENLGQMVEDRTQELKDSEEWHRRLLATAADTVLVYEINADGSSHDFIEVNPVASKMLGYTKKELLKMSTRDIVDLDSTGVDYAARTKDLLDKKKISFESVNVAKDGRKISVEISANLFEHKGRKIVISIVRDVTERKQLQEKLMYFEKMATVGQMASGIAHELRNPLAIINNSSYYLQMKMAGSEEKVVRHLAIIESQVFRSSHIIEGLLDFAATRQPNITTTDLHSILEEELNTLDIPGFITVSVDSAKDIPLLRVDRQQMLRVFNNLINNAIQAMPDGGELSIYSWEDADYVITEVTDTGGGISKENISKIFEPMFTTKSDMGGIGIGLAITKTLVEANKGTITVKSKLGKGTIFTIKLPIEKRM